MHNSQNKDAYAALKRQVLTKVMGHAEARMENAGILELNSDTLLGIKTLKKIFGLEKASPDYFPFMGTRNVLAQYCGFEDWAHWVRDLLGGESESERGAELVSIGVPASIGFPNVPFRNLNWFRREDARVFFGRNAEIRKILSFLREPLHDHWVLLYGQSGVGKSSFLNAGLHPRLEADFEVLVFRVSRDLPPENLFRSIQGAAIGVQKPLVVVLDQLETVFRRDMFSGPNWIMELAGLIEVCSFDITLILSFRKEFFAEIDAVLTEAEISFTRFFLKPLDSNGIEDAILGITQNRAANFKYQLKIDPEVPEAILDLIGSDDKSHIAPTLQIILTRLWERATEMGKWPPVFSSQLLLDNIKTRSHFLGEYIDESIELTQAIDPSWADTGLVFSLLKFFVSEEQTAGHRSKDEVELAFSHIPNIYELCRFLQDCHLLSESLDAESDILRLSHDALGPLIASRYNNSQLPGQIANRILTGRFIAADPDSNAAAIAVFDEPDLLLIEAGHGGMRHWTKAEAEVIERSRIAIHKRKRRARLQRIVQGSLVGIVVIFIAIVWQANQRQHLAQSKRSLILLHEAKAQLDPINGNLQKARAHYAEIVDLGYHQDSVFRHLAQFAQNYVFSFYYDTIQSFIPIMERARMDDPHRQSFFGELAFLGILAKDYAFVQRCLALAIPEMKEQTFVHMEKPALRRALIAEVKAHFGQQAWLDWQTKYLPHFVPVPPPLPDKEYPPGTREAICDTFWMADAEVTNLQITVFLNTNPERFSYLEKPAHLIKIEGPITVYNNRLFMLPGWSNSFAKEQNLPFMNKPGMAEKYSNWIGGMFPSEIEWEYAARGGPANAPFAYSGSDNLEEVANYRKLSRMGKLRAIKKGKPNELGIYDMTGNLSEILREDTVITQPDGQLISLPKIKGGSYRSFYEMGRLPINSTGPGLGEDEYLATGFRVIRYYPLFED